MNRRKSLNYTTIIVFALAIILIFVSRLSGNTEPVSRTFFAADTVCTITLYDGDEKILDGAVELCNSLANRLNCKDENSEVYELNKTKKADSPSADLLDVIQKGKYFSSLGNGVFDLTVKPLSDLWDFKNSYLPSENEIADATKKIDYNNLIVSEKDAKIALKNNAEIDLGGIAKGYIADKISDFLAKDGVKSGIINLGGNITVIGKKDDTDFNIGIQKPFEEGNIATISCNDTSVVTSGIYQRYFEKDGKIYHHLLNTKTGYPEQNGLYSVTIITKSATEADALSTLCFLSGLEKGMEHIEALDSTEAVFIDQNNKIHLTSGLKQNGNLIEIK